MIWAGFGLPVSVSGTLAERLLWPWATEQSAHTQSGILSWASHRSASLTCSAEYQPKIVQRWKTSSWKHYWHIMPFNSNTPFIKRYDLMRFSKCYDFFWCLRDILQHRWCGSNLLNQLINLSCMHVFTE